ncbi:hypothetical protein, partial [Aeromonas allosaccharophila]
AIKSDHKRSLFYIYFNWLPLKILYMIATYVFRQSDGAVVAGGYAPSPRQQKGRSAPRILYNAPL